MNEEIDLKKKDLYTIEEIYAAMYADTCTQCGGVYHAQENPECMGMVDVKVWKLVYYKHRMACKIRRSGNECKRCNIADKFISKWETSQREQKANEVDYLENKAKGCPLCTCGYHTQVCEKCGCEGPPELQMIQTVIVKLED